ncbi:MAG: preprotein translocase subunit SecY [Candidatus Woesearchaeota archaeon]
MGTLDKLIYNFPEVESPSQKRLSFKEKLKWTFIVLLIFFILGTIPLFGLGHNALQQFEYLSLILGAEFGSIISLGIGPIVTASIVLQLLNGSGLVKFDTTTEQGKRRFHGIQKLLSVFFIIFEAAVYVLMGGLSPPSELAGTSVYLSLELLLIFQLFLGGVLILFMDDVTTKWGFGSGVSLFIAAGVSKTIFVRAFNPFPSPTNPNIATGAIPALFQSLAGGDPITALLMLAAVVSTVVVFVMAVFGQSMKIEIPLSFGRVRGYGIRWPLAFIYTSNMPVILVSALFANIQLWARLLQNWGFPILGTFVGNTPTSGLVAWIHSPNIVGKIITGAVTFSDFIHAFVYLLLLITGCVIFSLFWVQTSGMDARSQARNIVASGLQIPGFRRDERVLEHILNRYIGPLTIMGAILVGLLAALADLSGALAHGTGILLTVMIVYRLYEDIATHHLYDMNPALRKFIE